MIEKIYSFYQQSTGVSTDTRSIEKGNIFFALKGPNFNANKFAARALENGALVAVIDDKNYEIPGKTILVEDTLAALQQMATHHRLQLSIPFLGITGSNGKTTTKELIYSVLQTQFKVVATQGNLNNHIGVPLTLLSINDDTEIAVIEMGANRVGDIKALCEIARPTHGLITNIGRAHIGLFGGFEGVIRGKSELYDFLLKNDGTVFINQNQSILANMGKRFKGPLYYPNETNFYHCTLIAADPFVRLMTEEGVELKTQLIGHYNFDNIATALCIGKFFKVDPEKSLRAVKNYLPQNNRSQVIEKNNNTLILDAYNANPSSMSAALENFRSMKGDKTLVILGDMFELGNDSEHEHRQIGKLVREYGFDDKIFCGMHMKMAHEECPDSKWFEDSNELITFLKNQQYHGYQILIKGSRGMTLEKILEFI
jgi:UDP-N-acetylmuramoyl-tripeptide--D-alanyl-D-alanine ligase